MARNKENKYGGQKIRKESGRQEGWLKMNVGKENEGRKKKEKDIRGKKIRKESVRKRKEDRVMDGREEKEIENGAKEYKA